MHFFRISNLDRPGIKLVAALAMALCLVACGGGGEGYGGVYVDVPVQQAVPAAPIQLSLDLVPVGPNALEISWSDYPYVSSYSVLRDGSSLASVAGTSLVDASLYYRGTYCYQVQGYDARGRLIATTRVGCIPFEP